MNKDEIKGYIMSFKRYAPYSLSEQEYKKKLGVLETKLNKSKDEYRN
jgi:hypothetical protein